MKYAIVKRRKLGIEVYTVVIQDGDKAIHSEFFSEAGAHNWLRKRLREVSNDRA